MLAAQDSQDGPWLQMVSAQLTMQPGRERSPLEGLHVRAQSESRKMRTINMDTSRGVSVLVWLCPQSGSKTWIWKQIFLLLGGGGVLERGLIQGSTEGRGIGDRTGGKPIKGVFMRRIPLGQLGLSPAGDPAVREEAGVFSAPLRLLPGWVPLG